MRLPDKRALITGAGAGLGREIALALARAGTEVIVTDRDTERVAETLAAMKNAGLSGIGHTLDVTVPEEAASLRERIHAEHGPIDLLVNNAGVVFGGDFLSVQFARHATTIAVNLTGLIAVTHAFLPDLIARPEAHLVNIASASAIVPLPGGATYAASKAAVVHFSDSLREELCLRGHRHVNVSSICPSYVSTGLFEGAKPARLTWLLTPESVAASILRAIERGRKTVLLPWPVAAMHVATRFLPNAIQRRVCRLVGVSSSMSNWRGHSDREKKSAS
jgi:all-trans-retinol dehydrogenase (NAD+)